MFFQLCYFDDGLVVDIWIVIKPSAHGSTHFVWVFIVKERLCLYLWIQRRLERLEIRVELISVSSALDIISADRMRNNNPEVCTHKPCTVHPEKYDTVDLQWKGFLMQCFLLFSNSPPLYTSDLIRTCSLLEKWETVPWLTTTLSQHFNSPTLSLNMNYSLSSWPSTPIINFVHNALEVTFKC